MDNSRDNNIFIFRAIGKFLYNKRWDPRKNESRTMGYSELMSFRSKPKFYESHQKIIDSTLMEPPQLALYLHENMLTHFHDINDVADAVETYSTLEGPVDRLDFE